jgi:hypothetical protein
MKKRPYDVLLLSDFRFPGGTSSAIAEEIKAGAAAGYRIGLIHVEAPNLTYPFPINPRIRTLIDAGLAEICDDTQPLEAGIALIHSPHVLRHMPFRCPRLRSEIRLLVVHHPPMSADGQPYYDANAVRVHADEVLGGEVLWAPVGPLVRAQLTALEDGPVLLPWDWYDVLDVAAWQLPRQRFSDPRPVIGRHTRPDRRKWPDTREQILAAYPDDPRILVRIMGGGSFLIETVGLYPRNWQVIRFDEISPREFLGGIDFFVYFHHSTWVEAFGCAIAEAMASGAVAILPAHFRELFREGAIYAEPAEVASHALRLRADPAAFRRQGQCGQALVEERFSHDAHRRRLAEIIGPPPSTRVAVPEPRAGHGLGWRKRQRRILFISSNGIGMGHLARLLAIARRCPEPLTPVFATMSQAVSVLRGAGYLADYLPYHDYLGCDINLWNKHLHQELNELLALYEPSVVVGDFNSPFQGVIDAITDNPHIWFVWCRRPMWKSGAGAKFIEREHYFAAVLEPQELAGAFDAGLTAASRNRTRTVAPIRLLDNHELLPRALARRELGLDLKAQAVIMLLGAGNNYDYEAVRQLIFDHLARRGDVQIVVAQWLMSDHCPTLPGSVIRVRRFPLARWFNAFDAAISAVGYNSFHELIFARVPTVFVPNENPQQDDQLARARYAERHGLGFCLRTRDIYQLKPTLDRLLDPEEQAAIREQCAALSGRNGAVDAATMIEELAYVHRVDRSRSI